MHDKIQNATRRLSAAGVDSPLLDAQLMMARAIGQARLFVMAHPEYQLDSREADAFESMLARRESRYPLAYILGEKEFYGIDLIVKEGVLVPRPDTEILVEETLRRVKSDAPKIADIGVGSGAISVAIAMNCQAAEVYATDTSDIAIEIAQANLAKHNLADRVRILRGDLAEPLIGMAFDAIVSNPPYIPSADIESLEPEVRVYEPRQALDGGEDGLDVYRRIFPEVRELLKPGGFVAVEIGAGESDDVRQIASEAGYRDIESIPDLAGIDRVVVAYI